jgi:menin
MDMPSPAVVVTDAALPDKEGGVAGTDSNEDQIKSTIEELVSRVGTEVQCATPNPNLAALAQACSESILNPEFLINGGEPFAMTPSEAEAMMKDAILTDPADEDLMVNKTQPDSAESFMDTGSGGGSHKTSPGLSSEDAQIVPSHTELEANTPPQHDDIDKMAASPSDSLPKHDDDDDDKSEPDSVLLSLHSAKMKGLKNILCARKLNGNAIKLQLTAQSQVHLKNSVCGNVTRKRLRRE